MTHRLKEAYDPEKFRQRGHELVDMLADHLQASLNQQKPVCTPISPDAALAHWEMDFAEHQQEEPNNFYQQLIEQSVALHHPKYMGHQVATPVPIAALSGLTADLLNNAMGIYEMGMGATAIEQLVVKILCRNFGFDEQAGGFMTSGGTLANLTALLAARSHRASEAVWENGHQQQFAIMVSEEAHYCVDRAVRIMGWGKEGIIKIPVNEKYQMNTALLEDALAKAKKENKEVIAIVGSACSTSTGAYDNLEAIADFCKQHELWFHVDGAHGAAAIFSTKYRALLKGIDRADSIVMDFHKMMMTPSIATTLLFQRENDSYQTFSQKAQYLWEKASQKEWYNLAKRTFECSKYMMSVKVYSIFRTHGPALFEDYINTLYDLGKSFAQMIEERPAFELAVQPQCNIVCFRFRLDGQDLAKENALNKNIRQTILKKGQFYIVQTQLQEKIFLRTTLMNPFTNQQLLTQLLDEVEQMGPIF